MQLPDTSEPHLAASAVHSALADDLVLSAEHAALYLCMTPAQLADTEKSRRSDGARAGKMVKSEQRFADLVKGWIRCAWLTAAEASTSRWADAAAHGAFAAPGLALLQQEWASVEAALAASSALAAG